MKQCLLQRGNRQQVAWIPSIYAIKGKYSLSQNQNGWEVLQVYMFQKEVHEQRGYFAGGVGR
jgi:hypothetical protein